MEVDAFVCHCQFLQRANMRCVLRIKRSLQQNCSISSFKREKNPTVLGHELLLFISVTGLETKRDVDCGFQTLSGDLKIESACLATTISNSPTKTSVTNVKTKTGNHATKMSPFLTKESYLRISSRCLAQTNSF